MIALALVFFMLALIGICTVRRDALLRYSAISGSTLGARLAIALGAQIDALDSNGGTALFEAAGRSHTEVVRLLIREGASASLVDNTGRTALCYSLLSGQPAAIETAELLIRAGALSSTPNPFGCIGNSTTSAPHIETLLKYGLDCIGHGDVTLITRFSREGNVAAVETLLNHGCDVNAMSTGGCTAITEAVRYGQPAMVRYLIEHAAIISDMQLLMGIARREQEKESRESEKYLEYERVVHLLEEAQGH